MSLLVRPISIGVAELFSSNVTETVPAYSATAPYTAGEFVYSAALRRIYQALVGGVKHAFATTDVNTATNVITWTAHGVADQTPIYFFTTGTLPAPLVAGTKYYWLAVNSTTFKVSATPGGPEIDLTTQGSGTHYVQLNAANFGNALTDTNFWLDAGPMNKWAMFDDSNLTATTMTGGAGIVVTITLPSRCDSVGLLALSGASSVRIVANNGSNFYDQTFNLAETAFSDDWYAATYAEVFYKNRLAVSAITPNTSTKITITISGSGTVSCGSCVIGLSKNIGDAIVGASIGIDDYSLIKRDDFGNLDILERGYSDRGDFSLTVVTGKSEALRKLIADYRATPALFLMMPDTASPGGWNGSGIIYGLPRSFKREVRGPCVDIFSLELEGVT